MDPLKRELRAFAYEFYSKLPVRYHASKSLLYSCSKLSKYAPSRFASAFLTSKLGSPLSSLMFSNFCGGSTLNDAMEVAFDYSNKGIGTILDRIGEPPCEKVEKYMSKSMLEYLPNVSKSPKVLYFSIKLSAIFGVEELEHVTHELNFKAQRKASHALSPDGQTVFLSLAQRLQEVKQSSVYKVLIDAEWSDIQPAISALSYELMTELNQAFPFIFGTYQSYNIDAFVHFEKHLAKSHSDGIAFGAKLVRGAYYKYESSKNPSPVFGNINETHKCFDRLLKLSLDSDMHPNSLIVATHNEDSIVNALNLIQIFGQSKIVFAQLHGMRDYVTNFLSSRNLPVLKYVPYGAKYEAIPYLVRRLEENSGFFDSLEFEKKLIYKQFLKKIIRADFQ